MNDIETTLLATLPNGSTVQRCLYAGRAISGKNRDGGTRDLSYAAGSVLLVSKDGEIIVGPIDSQKTADLALGVATGDSHALTAPRAIHILALAVIALSTEIAIDAGIDMGGEV